MTNPSAPDRRPAPSSAALLEQLGVLIGNITPLAGHWPAALLVITCLSHTLKVASATWATVRHLATRLRYLRR